MTLDTTIRWALVPLASIFSCSGTVLAADVISEGVSSVMTPEIGTRVEAIMPIDVRAGIVYALAAVAWVVFGTRVAPRYRRVVAMVTYLAGAVLAWNVLDGWQVPEGYPQAYQVSHVPLVLTLAGGFLSVVALMARASRTRTPADPEA